MITLTRNQVRRLRVAFRRAALGIAHRGIISELVLRAEGAQLRAQHRYCDLAVEHIEMGSYRPATSIAIPLDALADFEGSVDSPVVIEAVAPDRTVVRWDDRSIPQNREYHIVTPVERREPMPGLPATWASNPGDLLDSLTAATEVSTPDSPRHSLECIQLQGNEGKILATDGRQGLVRSGYTFPWTDSILIRARPIFGCRAIPRDQPVEVGRTDTHVVVRAGAWTLYCEIQKEARFPDLQRVILADGEVSTRLHLDPADARFLGSALDRLPGGDDLHRPVTLDMNGRIAVRASGADHPAQVTELILDRSRYTGDPLRIVTNRTFVDRALRLGLTAFGFAGADSPFVCRDDRKVFTVQPLGAGSPLEANANVTRIESGAAVGGDGRAPARSEAARSPTSEAVRWNGRDQGRPVEAHGHHPATTSEAHGHRPARRVETAGPAGHQSSGTSLAALIQEAESLHAALADAKSRTARLISGLRRHRKQSRLVSETLKSLRELKLQDVVA
jgi:hypothetical protein